MARRRDRGAAVLANPMFAQHPFLQFDHATYTQQQRTQFRANLEENISQPIEAFSVLDWAAMDRVIDEHRDGELGTKTLHRITTMTYYLPTGDVGFVSYAWERLFQIEEPIFRELVIEFFSTFQFDHKSTRFREDSMYFQLGGVPRTMSVVEFAQALELYTADELHNPHFDAHLGAARRNRYTSAEVAESWALVGNGEYGARGPSYIFIRSAQHRLIHRLLVFSIAARREGPEKVHGPDLFYLTTMVRGTLVNVPWLLAHWMHRKATGTRASSSICGGQYVTRLARWFGLEAAGVFNTCTPVLPGMDHLTIPKLEDLGILISAATLLIPGDAVFWVQALLPGQAPPRRGGQGADAGVPAVGRGRGRGHGGDMSIHERLDRMELESSHHLAYQDHLLQQIMTFHQLPWQPYVPYDFGGPAEQHGEEPGDEGGDGA